MRLVREQPQTRNNIAVNSTIVFLQNNRGHTHYLSDLGTGSLATELFKIFCSIFLRLSLVRVKTSSEVLRLISGSPILRIEKFENNCIKLKQFF